MLETFALFQDVPHVSAFVVEFAREAPLATAEGHSEGLNVGAGQTQVYFLGLFAVPLFYWRLFAVADGREGLLGAAQKHAVGKGSFGLVRLL